MRWQVNRKLSDMTVSDEPEPMQFTPEAQISVKVHKQQTRNQQDRFRTIEPNPNSQLDLGSMCSIHK